MCEGGEECEECYIVHYIVYYEFIGENSESHSGRVRSKYKEALGLRAPAPKTRNVGPPPPSTWTNFCIRPCREGP